MNGVDNSRTITSAVPIGFTSLRLAWSDATIVDLDLGTAINDQAYSTLGDQAEFAQVRIGDWGHSLVWPSGVEMGADSLWLETLSATGHDDARAFLEWRLRHALSLTKAADALGLSRRMVAYYSNGEKKVPKSILLACRGWEVGAGQAAAA